MEWAIYRTVLHRLFERRSNRAAERCRRDVRLATAEGLEFHRLYRAMRCLGETKEAVEAALFRELCPGNMADSRALLPIVDRLRQRFGNGEPRRQQGLSQIPAPQQRGGEH